MVSIYNQLTYEEDDRKSNPYLYSNESIGNRKVEHVTVVDKELLEEILNIREISYLLTRNIDALGLSVLWNLPRKKYNESTQWVCMSGYVYNSKEVIQLQHFVISNNIYDEEDQLMAKQILELVNTNKL